MKKVGLQLVAVDHARNNIVFGLPTESGAFSSVTLTVPEHSMNGALSHIHANLKVMELIREFSALLNELTRAGECSETLNSISEQAVSFLDMSAQCIVHQYPVMVTTESGPGGGSANIHSPMLGYCSVDSADLDIVAFIVQLLTDGYETRALLQSMTPWIGGYLNEMHVEAKECQRIERLVQSANDIVFFSPVRYRTASAMLHVRDSDRLDVVNGTLQVNGTPVVVEYPQCERVYLDNEVISIKFPASNKANTVGREFVLYTYA